MRLERFDVAAQEAFQEGQEIMHAEQHTQLDVEHIFLAMLRRPSGTAAQVLERLGANLAKMVERVERELQKLPKVYGQSGYGNQVYITPRTQRMVKRAEAEADRLNNRHVGIAHFLLALTSEQDGASSRVLRDFGIDQARLVEALPELAGEPAPDEPATPPRSSTASAEPAALRQQIAALELQNQHLQELLKVAQENLAYTRGLLEKEIALRHWAERRRLEREGGPEEQAQA